MDYQDITLEKDGAVATVTVSREKQLNALNGNVLTELISAVSELELDDDVRVVLLTGAGKAFVAGADISEMQHMDARTAHGFATQGGHLGELIETSAKAYIACVGGFALGGGCELAMACDFIYASSKSKFGQPEVKLGVIPGFGGTQRLMRRVGVAKAKELIFSGDMISAEEAQRIGLVDKISAPEELLADAQAMAGRICKNSPRAVAEAKRVMQSGQSLPLGAALELEAHAFATLFGGDEQIEGMAAFVEKRDANF